jgi:hypothetical protein
LNIEVAKQISSHLESLMLHANHVLQIANNSGDDKFKGLTQETLGFAISEIDLNIWEYVYKQFPELKPKELD